VQKSEETESKWQQDQCDWPFTKTWTVVRTQHLIQCSLINFKHEMPKFASVKAGFKQNYFVRWNGELEMSSDPLS